jgi:hypothetical protein
LPFLWKALDDRTAPVVGAEHALATGYFVRFARCELPSNQTEARHQGRQRVDATMVWESNETLCLTTGILLFQRNR